MCQPRMAGLRYMCSGKLTMTFYQTTATMLLLQGL